MIAVSTGNHGQSVAFAARKFGVYSRIVVPQKANPGKVAAMRGMGAEVIFSGGTFDEARLHCETLAGGKGYRYIHSGDEPLLIAGVATEALEMLEDQPGLEFIFVPVGGGSGAAGACIVARAVDPRIRVVGVQSEASPAAYESWRQKKLVEAPNRTFAEALSTGTAFSLPQAILREYDRVHPSFRPGNHAGYGVDDREGPHPRRSCRGGRLGRGLPHARGSLEGRIAGWSAPAGILLSNI